MLKHRTIFETDRHTKDIFYATNLPGGVPLGEVLKSKTSAQLRKSLVWFEASDARHAASGVRRRGFVSRLTKATAKELARRLGLKWGERVNLEWGRCDRCGNPGKMGGIPSPGVRFLCARCDEREG